VTTLPLPRSLPHMGRRARQGGVGLLAAVLAAGAVVGTVAAERATVGHVVPGLGTYAGGRYCIEQYPPFQETTTPDTVTLWTTLDGQSVQSGAYSMHDATDVANMRSEMDRAVKIEECWEDK